jgi:hypothetical protein
VPNFLKTNTFNLKSRKIFAWDICFYEPSRNGVRYGTDFIIIPGSTTNDGNAVKENDTNNVTEALVTKGVNESINARVRRKYHAGL